MSYESASGITYYVIPGFPSPGPNDAPYMIFGYWPTVPFAAVALVAFALAAFAHTILMIKYRTPRYYWLVMVGCLIEVVGYAIRLQAHYQPYNITWFVTQYSLIVLAPILFSAALYACLSSLIQGRWVIWTFVFFDIMTTIIQCAGSAGIGVTESNSQDPLTFVHILTAGLAVQTFSFLLFLTILITFLNNARKIGYITSKADSAPVTGWRRRLQPGKFQASKLQIWLLLAAALLIFARTVFRLGEAAGGVNNKAATTEVIFAMLDFFPVILAVIIMGIGHPGRYARCDATETSSTIFKPETQA